MRTQPTIVRDAAAADLARIIEIYNAAIAGRLATADTEPIAVASRIEWMRGHDSTRHPLRVAQVDAHSYDQIDAHSDAHSDAQIDGRIVGWLSFQPFYGRPAYGSTAELSVYVAPERQRAGIGRTLLAGAIEAAPGLGLKTLLGFIFGHNAASLGLFESFAFQRWALLPRVAELDGIERDLVIVGRRVGI